MSANRARRFVAAALVLAGACGLLVTEAWSGLQPSSSAAVGRAGEASLTAIRAAYARPDSIPFPRGNPYTEAKERLGQTLFFDPRVSGSGTMSCATCHNPALGWEDGRAARGGMARTRSAAPRRPS